jgi:hypothetical protein
MEKLIIYKQYGCPLAHTKFFMNRDALEVCKVLFENGVSYDILTLRCTKHLHCDCGVKRTLNIIYNMSKPLLPKQKKIRKAGKMVSFRRYLTRELEIWDAETAQTHPQIFTYGFLDEKIEKEYMEKLKEQGREGFNKLLKKYGRRINAPFISLRSLEIEK